MIKKILLENCIILYWDRDPNFDKGYKYCICYNKNEFYTKKTHYTLEVPKGTQCVEISVSLVDEKNNVCKQYEEEKVFLQPSKKKIDVTKSPYFAVGDGKTLNSSALQLAFDNCKADEIVYIPNGK